MRLLGRKLNKKGQATTELAIMGVIVIMILGYLLQQGYIYNARQALEMYTFREALRQSRIQERGINLTVMRDVISPSFFSGLNRQRLMASASVDYNPWKIYIPDVAQDLPSRQLLQVGEAMIRNRLFFEVPATQVRIVTEGNQDTDEEDQWQWTNSAIREIDPQTPDERTRRAARRISAYSNATQALETNQSKVITKDLASTDAVGTNITFEDAESIRESYLEDDWLPASEDASIINVVLREDTIPDNIKLQLDENVRRTKITTTPH